MRFKKLSYGHQQGFPILRVQPHFSPTDVVLKNQTELRQGLIHRALYDRLIISLLIYQMLILGTELSARLDHLGRLSF